MFNSKGDLLFVITFLTIVVARLSVVLVSGVDIVFLGFVVHYFLYGVLFLAMGLLIRKEKSILHIVVIGIGLGLVIDQLVFMIIGAGGDREYWSYTSVVGTLLLVITAFISKERITRWLTVL